jgi:cob(I)alamin adenosyltransferase
MVKLTRIYTGGGDGGETSLANGERVPKHDLRIAAVGTVDEANSFIGCARRHAEGKAAAMLARIQNDLFDLGAELGRADAGVTADCARGLTGIYVKRLEDEIDALNADLKPLDSFILPGGSAAAAELHLARTVVRRAERLITDLDRRQPVNPQVLRYINRLSDHLFVLARHLNDGGEADELWRPGANR